jgi:phosphoglucomutase
MSQKISPLAGKPAPKSILVDIAKLLAAYADLQPDPGEAAQRVAFGTSGHRGSSFQRSFNEWHILAISQAICEYRKSKGIDGPLFIGFDTHALSQPAFESALEVLAANGVETMISAKGEFTPRPRFRTPS